MGTTLLFVCLVVGFAMGLPIAIAIVGSVIVYMVVSGFDFYALAQLMVSAADSMTILAIPGFIIAGELMDSGGLSKRLVAFCEVFVSKIKGGLAAVSLLASMMFAAISGSGIATTLSIGGIMVPEMEKRGYPKAYAAATAAAGGVLGPIIPPSIGIVVYGAATGVSITAMFKAGFSVGIFVGIVLILYSLLWCSRRYKLPVGVSRGSFKETMRTVGKALPAIGAPVIIAGGIFSGLFTPTEASVVTIAYSLVVGLFVYKELTFKKIRTALFKSAGSVSSLMLIQVFAALFGYVLTIERVPNSVLNAISSISSNIFVLLLIINVVLLILGCFMSGLTIIVISAPLLTPLATFLGMDQIHFAMMMLVNLGIGQISPPFGNCLYAGVMVSNEPFSKVCKYIWGFVITYVVSLIFVIAIPGISTIFL